MLEQDLELLAGRGPIDAQCAERIGELSAEPTSRMMTPPLMNPASMRLEFACSLLSGIPALVVQPVISERM
jgi:hypothetical protein